MRSVERGLAPLSTGGLSARELTAVLLAHIAFWTVAISIAQSSGVVHHDMTEAYDWGQEFQLGYFKHPPLFPWVAGAWFRIFPRSDWAFYLLSAVNAAGGLLGLWCLAGRLMLGREQTATLLFAMLAPFFTIMAATFNGNSILLLVWPWTAYTFVRSVQSPGIANGALFGLAAGLAMLAKYTSLLLLVSCLAAAIAHPAARRYFASPAPYVAIATGLALFAPHLAWAVTHAMAPVEYVMERTQKPAALVALAMFTSLCAALLFFALPLGAFALAWRGSGPLRLGKFAVMAGGRQWRWLSALALGPAVLTLLAGGVLGLKVSTNYLLPCLIFLPVAFVAIGGITVTVQRQNALWRSLAIWLGVVLVAAPIFAAVSFATRADQAAQPRREVAVQATKAWREAFGVPVKIAAGSAAYGLALPFYSADAPHYYALEEPKDTPWITTAEIARDGLLIVCVRDDLGCIVDATRIAGRMGLLRFLRVTREFAGWTTDGAVFEVFMLPPHMQK